MTTTADEAAFLREIAANPEDDTARLVFADWLDDHPLPDVVCRECDGKGGFSTPDYDGGMCDRFWDRCMACHGTGTIRDTSRRDRAEFIRAQIRMHAISPTGLNIPKESLQEWYELESRANELKREKWAKCPCPACERYDPYKLAASYGRARASEILESCPVCQGTRDILTASLPTYVGGSDPRHESRNPTFRRGFIDSVECRLEELGATGYAPCQECIRLNNQRGPGGAAHRRCGNCDGGAIQVFAPSPWAKAVVTTLPVARFRLAGYEPFKGTHPTWGWCVGEDPTWALPRLLFDSLPDEGRSQRNAPFWKDYLTPAAALDALAVAAARVIRRAVYGS